MKEVKTFILIGLIAGVTIVVAILASGLSGRIDDHAIEISRLRQDLVQLGEACRMHELKEESAIASLDRRVSELERWRKSRGAIGEVGAKP